MKSTLFTLVNIADPQEVVALGMEITFEEPRSGEQRRVATTYVPDLSGDGRDTQTRHASAEAARDFFSRLLPVGIDLQRPGGNSGID